MWEGVGPKPYWAAEDALERLVALQEAADRVLMHTFEVRQPWINDLHAALLATGYSGSLPNPAQKRRFTDFLGDLDSN